MTEAFIVQNLGGRVKASLHNLLFVEHFTQGRAIKDVVVIHHTGRFRQTWTKHINGESSLTKSDTDCGLTHTKEEDIQADLKATAPQLADEIDRIDFGNYDGSNLEK